MALVNKYPLASERVPSTLALVNEYHLFAPPWSIVRPLGGRTLSLPPWCTHTLSARPLNRLVIANVCMDGTCVRGRAERGLVPTLPRGGAEDGTCEGYRGAPASL